MKYLLCFAVAVALVAAECDAMKNLKCATDSLSCLTSAGQDKGKVCNCMNTMISCGEAAGCPASAETKQKLEEAGCNAACFPATAIVELENGKTKSMDELVIGDKVRVGPKEYSEVFLFTTKMSETTSKFTKIVTEHTVIKMTHFHYLYANGELMQAHRVKVGDVIVLANGTKAPVTEVSTEWAPGLYNPHTLHGDIIVDGVKTSTYTSAVHPTLAHALLKPVAALYKAGVNFGEGFSAAIKSHLPSWVAGIIKAA